MNSCTFTVPHAHKSHQRIFFIIFFVSVSSDLFPSISLHVIGDSLIAKKKIRQQRVLKAFFQESEEIDRVFVNEGKKTPKQWVRLPPFNCIVNEMSVFLDEPKYHHWINSFVMFQKPNILFGFRLDVSIEVNILHFSFGSFGFRSRFFSHTLNLGSSFSGKSFDLG